MRFKWVLILSLAVSFALNANAAVHQCASIKDPRQRLKCFDQSAKTANKPKSQQRTQEMVNDQAILSVLRSAWGENILAVSSLQGVVKVLTNFDTINQTTYEVMVATVCGRIMKDPNQFSNVKTISVLNRSKQQGYQFTDARQCAMVAFKPVERTKLSIMGSTKAIGR